MANKEAGKSFSFFWVRKRGHKVSTRFRNINIALFLVVSVMIMIASEMLLSGISDTVSKDYAYLYSANTSASLSTYLSKEIALVGKAARSDAVVSWFSDEFNEDVKANALNEMLETIDALYTDNMYLAIDGSLNEYTIEEYFSLEDVKPHAALLRDYYDDAWYFECIESPNDYKLNVDIDKILHRKLVWINHKVIKDGVPIGIICSGLSFASTVETLFAEYDNTQVRSVIIDDTGVVQMDSESLWDEDFIRYEHSYDVEDEFDDPAFLDTLRSYLDGIEGFFNSSDPIIQKLSGGLYSYSTISPIEGTNWSVITFYNSSSLFNATKLMPLLIAMLVMLIIYALITGSIGYRLLFRPIELLILSLSDARDKGHRIYGIERRDEIGDLSLTIQNMKDRLDRYSSDLEKDVEERSAELSIAYNQAKEQNRIIMSSIDYASKIQRHLLPSEECFRNMFSDYSIIWKPRDVVGGDIYWLKKYCNGTILCVCDCTGHGTPGALLTMLVVSALEAIVTDDTCEDTAYIIWELEQRLVTLLNARTYNSGIKDGCDLALLFIADNGEVSISSGHMHVFICDGNEVTQVKGQKLYIGEGKIKSLRDIKTVKISANPDNKFYIASDGLYEQKGGEYGRPFGYSTLKRVILENHNERQSLISDKIWEEFERYRGDEIQVDDVELITFKP